MAPQHSSIDGIALWAPRLPGWARAQAILRGDEPAPVADAPRPVPTILPPAERRRAPDSVVLALEVAMGACESAGCTPSAVPSVFASTQGDLSISDYMASTLAADPRLISPTRFHNSVHNAPAGYWTIATGSMRAYTALSTYEDTFANALLEALVQSASAAEQVLLVAYDIEARGPLASVAKSRGLLAAALVIGPVVEAGPRASRAVAWRIEDGPASASAARPQNAALVEGNALAACLPLYEALSSAGRESVALRLSAGKTLHLDLDALSAVPA